MYMVGLKKIILKICWENNELNVTQDYIQLMQKKKAINNGNKHETNKKKYKNKMANINPNT